MTRAPLNQASTGMQASTTVEVGFPSRLKIDLVQGAELRHYELFLTLGSLAMSTAVGFWTGYITTSPAEPSFLWSALAFTGLAVFSGVIAFRFRLKIFNGRVRAVTTLDKFTKEEETKGLT